MNAFSIIEKILHKIAVKTYSFYVGRRLRERGRNFHIEYPATIYAPKFINIGKNAHIRAHVWFNCTAKETDDPVLKIGNNVYIGRFVQISAKELVVIQDHVMLSDRVYVGDYGHEFEDDTIPVYKQPLTKSRPVTIKEGAWIGVGAVVLPGVTIGRNAVVGANAVVTGDVPDNHIARGIPAKVFPKNRQAEN